MEKSYIAKVAVSAAPYWVDRPFDYSVPENLLEECVPGVRVVVPFGRGNRRSEGFVLRVSPENPKLNIPFPLRFPSSGGVAGAVPAPDGVVNDGEAAGGLARPLKAIEQVLDRVPVAGEEQLKLALWMRERFFCTVYSALKAMLPAGLWFDSRGVRRVGDKTVKMIELSVSAEEALALAEQKRKSAPMMAELLRVLCSAGRISVPELRYFTGAGAQSVNTLVKNGLAAVDEKEVYRRPVVSVGGAPLPELTPAQARVFDGLTALADGRQAKAALLLGVTGSGKTTVYLHLIDRLCKAGKSAILLVPEIALTPQMIETFSAHFGDGVAVLHSSLAVGERLDEWKRIKSGAARVVVGTRSAVFAPVADLGAIIIDEEQEDTYRSENDPRYHARDVAKFRCARGSALLLLGSATPSVESRYAAESGKYAFFTLPARFNGQALPAVEIVDMKRELRAENKGSVSGILREELQKNLDNGEQSILFINRRGASKLVTCIDCGYTYRCPRCSVNLTYHSVNRRLLCHYCGFSRAPDRVCPECGGSLSFVGDGTQRVVEELSGLFPGVPVLRMDTDTVAPAGSHNALLSKFRAESIPILVGTQMVTKGLNFENVTLVGVLNADQSLYAGNYRSAERTFSLITQVVGRSGRGERLGRAVIQTFTPQNQVILQAAVQDYESFYAAEIALRKLQSSPPFFELYAVNASGPDEHVVLKCCHAAKQLLERALSGGEAAVLGPAPLAVVKVSDRYRYRVMISSKNGRRVREALPGAVEQLNTDKAFRGVSVYAEKDPGE
ncbi:MAG: primosomal protein N' [Firmicutes bacterium]|nr:primosomal protein N' [Bacillota bacterium]